MKLGKLEPITDLCSVWRNEAKKYIPWLAKGENLAALGDAIGIDIVLEEQESNVGDFSVDLYDLSVGSSAYHIALSVNTQYSQLVINDDKDIYKKFKESESLLETTLNGKIKWRDAKKTSRFLITNNFGISNTDKWSDAFSWYFDNCLKKSKY